MRRNLLSIYRKLIYLAHHIGENYALSDYNTYNAYFSKHYKFYVFPLPYSSIDAHKVSQKNSFSNDVWSYSIFE